MDTKSKVTWRNRTVDTWTWAFYARSCMTADNTSTTSLNWRCPYCGYEYESFMSVVNCKHPNSTLIRPSLSKDGE